MSNTKTLNGVTYHLTFQDNFDTFDAFTGHGSDGHWATSFSPHLDDTRFLTANGEGQYYTNPDEAGLPNPFSVNNGVLSIHAHELTASEQALADGQLYGSGMLATELSFGTQNGYIEIAANVPDQQGFLSSFWLLPMDGDWSAEIDVFETLGHNTDLLNTNVWDDGNSNQLSIPTIDMSDGFHVYGLEWTEDTITWYLDGVPVRTVDNTVQEDMYLVASLAVDTTWTGSVDATTDFSDPFQIDYIHVYEEDAPGNNRPVTGNEILADAIEYTNGSADGSLFGTGWADTFLGNSGADTLYGRDGDDVLSGNEGNDTLFGQVGADTLLGGIGDDKLIGGGGEDILVGGAGKDNLWGGTWGADGNTDIFVFAADEGKDFVHDFETGIDKMDLTSFGVTWADIQSHSHDHGWATKIDLDALGGNAGDMVYLINVDATDLTAGDFIL